MGGLLVKSGVWGYIYNNMALLRQLLMENVDGANFISVDIQPEYESHFGFSADRFCGFLNDNRERFGSCVLLYNGADTLGMVSENDYKMWLVDNGCEEQTIDTIEFYDKGYAFFRYCMDNSLDDSVIANFVRFMYNNDIRDSRDMDREMWAKYLRQYRRTDKKIAYDLLKVSDDCVHIPELMDYLKRYTGNILLTGGGVNECLKEVEIALMSLNKTYSLYRPFVY